MHPHDSETEEERQWDRNWEREKEREGGHRLKWGIDFLIIMYLYGKCVASQI